MTRHGSQEELSFPITCRKTTLGVSILLDALEKRFGSPGLLPEPFGLMNMFGWLALALDRLLLVVILLCINAPDVVLARLSLHDVLNRLHCGQH